MSFDSKYDLLLNEDDSVYMPPKFATVSAIQDLGRHLQQEVANLGLLGSKKHKTENGTQPLVEINQLSENDVFDMNQYLNVNSFDVDYIKFPLTIQKRQVRHNGVSEMRLDQKDGKIEIHLVFEGMQFKDIFQVNLQVRRLNAIPNYLKLYTGYVTLSPVEMCEGNESPNTAVVHAHLDNLLEEDYQKNIYKLAKTNNPKHNEFVVLIEVSFHDFSVSNFTTRSFIVTGQKFADKRKAPDNPGPNIKTQKMPVHSPGSMASSIKSPMMSVSSPGSTGSSLHSPRMFESIHSPNENRNFATHQRLVYDIIEAKQGLFDNLQANVIKSGNGDIAYHFELKDQTSRIELKPGEVIGFTTDERGKVVIEKLSASNARKTFLKGVVTESQYIEAFHPQDTSVITATICMLGVVPVCVRGPVLPGEGLFASEENPGTAVSEKSTGICKSDAHIGYAFERVDCSQYEVNDVQGLVSILSSAGQDLVVRRLSVLEKSLKHSIKFNTVRSRKCFGLLMALLLLLGVIIGVIIYQVKGSGTLFQKWMCKQGSVGEAKYWYWSQGGEYFGYQFPSLDVAWERAINKRKYFKEPHCPHSPPVCLNVTSVSGKIIKFNYYINLESCANVPVPGARYLFAIDKDCRVLYLFDEMYGKWRRDKHVCSERCNMICNNKKKSCTSSTDTDICSNNNKYTSVKCKIRKGLGGC